MMKIKFSHLADTFNIAFYKCGGELSISMGTTRCIFVPESKLLLRGLLSYVQYVLREEHSDVEGVLKRVYQ